MQPQYKNKFGRVDLNVSAFGFGTAPVGNIFKEIDEKTSDDMFQAAWKAGYVFTTPHQCMVMDYRSIGQDIPFVGKIEMTLYYLLKSVDCCISKKRDDQLCSVDKCWQVRSRV